MAYLEHRSERKCSPAAPLDVSDLGLIINVIMLLLSYWVSDVWGRGGYFRGQLSRTEERLPALGLLPRVHVPLGHVVRAADQTGPLLTRLVVGPPPPPGGTIGTIFDSAIIFNPPF